MGRQKDAIVLPANRAERVRGAVWAQALGDALGAPFEFSAQRVEWIDRLQPFTGRVGPHGPWVSPAPAGTGTDDVRYAWLFMDLAHEVRGMPTAAALAQHLIDLHERPGDVFPNHAPLARAQFAMWEGVSRGYLGQPSPLYPGVSPSALATRSVGLNYPTIAGMLAMPFAGLLSIGQPERAYCAAYEAAFFDVGYAREATALLAAAQSLAAAGVAPGALVERVLALDPLQLGGYFGPPFVVEHLPPLLERARGKRGAALADYLSFELRHMGVFDPYRALAVAFCALLAHADEPLCALQVAANQGDLDAGGRWRRYADIDCYASITGSLIGAVCGAAELPSDVVQQVIDANRTVYGIDLEARAARFARLVEDGALSGAADA